MRVRHATVTLAGMGRTPPRRAWWCALLAFVCTACAPRHDEAPGARATTVDTLAAQAIARDARTPIVMPLSPPGAGQWRVERVAEAQTALVPEVPITELDSLVPMPPPAEPAPPPESEASVSLRDPLRLKPPIPRGAPVLPHGGRGGRVVLDVRVDEDGLVTDVQPAEGDADAATRAAAVRAAFASRWYPALLGDRRVAVWTRQVFEVTRAR